MCHSFLIVYYWNDTEFLTLPTKVLLLHCQGFDSYHANVRTSLIADLRTSKPFFCEPTVDVKS
ncbi:hypothetical protein FXQ87_14125 [Salmonella enterica]|nr:hypothetical protein [Salmonella enterica]